MPVPHPLKKPHPPTSHAHLPHPPKTTVLHIDAGEAKYAKISSKVENGVSRGERTF